MNLPLHEALGITRPAVFATVGGGGKTTVLFALAEEWRAAGGDGLTVLTTTTKMTIPREGRSLSVVADPDETNRVDALNQIRGKRLATAVVGSGRGSRGRVLSIDPDWPRDAVDANLATLVGVEADGSKGRNFKAPASHEPVLPTDVDVVAAVIGAGVLGRPLDERWVHRPEIVARVSGASLGEEITPQLAASVMTSPEGGRKGVSASVQFVVLVSNASWNVEGSRALASECERRGADRVLLWDATSGLLEVKNGTTDDRSKPA